MYGATTAAKTKVAGSSKADTREPSSQIMSFLYYGLSFSILIGLILHFYPLYPDIKPIAFRPLPPPSLEGSLAKNGFLDKAKNLYPHLMGAESVAPADGFLITGLIDGRVVRLSGNETEILVDCDSTGKHPERRECGRPLGIRFDETRQFIYVADSVNGLYKLNLRTLEKTTLYSSTTSVGGQASVLVDDLTVTSEGVVYFTDASTRWNFFQLHFDISEAAPNGRVLRYNPTDNTTKVVVSYLFFPNGIQLSPKEDYFLFCETSRFRLMKYHLKGEKRGSIEVFVDNLPGYPDNVRLNERGNYWVGMVFARGAASFPPFLELLGPYPQLRKFSLKLAYLLALPFTLSDAVLGRTDYNYINDLVTYLVMYIGSGPRYGLVLEIDENGEILRSLHSQNGSVHSISQAIEYNGTLYMGSPWEPGLFALKLDDTSLRKPN